MTHNRKSPEPTIMSRVEGALEAADDFLTAAMLVERSGTDLHHVQTCLWYLRKMEGADSLESGDALWWFLTPESDRRTKRVEMRRPEDRPRRKRRVRAIALPHNSATVVITEQPE